MTSDFLAAGCPRRRLKSSEIVTFNISGGTFFELRVARKVVTIVISRSSRNRSHPCGFRFRVRFSPPWDPTVGLYLGEHRTFLGLVYDLKVAPVALLLPDRV